MLPISPVSRKNPRIAGLWVEGRVMALLCVRKYDSIPAIAPCVSNYTYRSVVDRTFNIGKIARVFLVLSVYKYVNVISDSRQGI